MQNCVFFPKLISKQTLGMSKYVFFLEAEENKMTLIAVQWIKRT